MSALRWSVSLVLLCLLATQATANEQAASRHRNSPLVGLVREATDRFWNVETAIAEGYAPGPCVSGPNAGAMGVHYINGALVGDGAIDATQPEALIYQPKPNGQLRLVGVEYIVLAGDWDAANPGTPPVLEGHLLNFVGSPNRYAIPAFYELHVWAWRKNPSGTFADWNPNVTCDAQTSGAMAH